MAEFLLLNRDLPGDADHLGDIIHVAEDGAEWGRKECLGDFIVVRLEGISVEDAQQYLGPLFEDAETKTIKYCCRYHVDLSKAITATTLAMMQISDWYVPVITSDMIVDKNGN